MYLIALALLPLVLAQYGGDSGQTTTTSMTASSSAAMASASSTVHSVDVGNGALVFEPSSITANKGDEIEFHFYPKNHSVVQSTFTEACNPMTGGFYSGFQPAANGENSLIFTVTVNDTKPIWVYCSQASHCQGGMAMVINPPAGSANTLDAYKALAKTAKTQSPANIAGGVFSESTEGNASSTAASGSGTATGSAAPSSTSSVAGGRYLEWSTVGLTGIGALIFGGLLM